MAATDYLGVVPIINYAVVGSGGSSEGGGVRYSPSAISFETVHGDFAANAYWDAATRLDATHVLKVYVRSTISYFARVGTISGSTISWGAEQTLFAQGTDVADGPYCAVHALNSSLALLYYGSGSADKVRGLLVNTSTGAVTASSAVNGPTTGSQSSRYFHQYTSTAYDTDTVFTSIRQASGSNQLTLRPVDLPNYTSASFGTAVDLLSTAAKNDGHRLVVLNSTKGCVVYRDNSTNAAELRFFDISAGVATAVGTEQILDSSSAVKGFIDFCAFSTTTGVLIGCTNNGSGNSRTVTVWKITMDTVANTASASQVYSFDPAASPGFYNSSADVSGYPILHLVDSSNALLFYSCINNQANVFAHSVYYGSGIISVGAPVVRNCLSDNLSYSDGWSAALLQGNYVYLAHPHDHIPYKVTLV